MYSIRFIFFSLGLFLTTLAHATSTYNPTTNILTIDSVIDNGVQYNNVVVNLGASFSVISVGSSAPVVSGTCSSSNFSLAVYNAITVGMTLNQVNQAMGCNYDSTKTINSTNYVARTWFYQNASTFALEEIVVYFDPITGNTVIQPVKFSSGF
ncbi:MAG: hypothetical protein ACXV74_00575 [Methylobacter sp.]